MANHEAYINGDSTHDQVGRVNELINNGGTGGDTDSPISAPTAAVETAIDVDSPMSSQVDSPLNNIGSTFCIEMSFSGGPEQNTGSQFSLGTGGDTDSPIPAPAVAVAVDTIIDIESQMSSPGDSPLGIETSLSEGPEQNTGNPRGGLGPNQTNWIRWSVALDAFNFVLGAMLSVPVNLTNLFMNRSNSIWQLLFLAGTNLFSNTLVAVNYLYGEAQKAHERNWMTELIASVGAPIAVSVFTLLSIFRFASAPERWSNWIAELSRLNAAMIGGGPLAFYWMRNGETEN